MSRLAVAFVTVAVVVVAAAATAQAVGGGVRETLQSVMGPDLLDDPRGVAGLAATAAVLAGGLGVLITIMTSLRRPEAETDYEMLGLRLENALARLELRSVDGHVIVCGAGPLGHAVADELASRGIDAIVLERDAARARRARVFLPFLLEGDPRDAETLRRAGAGRARAAMACAERERENERIAAAAANLNLPVVVASAWPSAAAAVDALTAAARR